MIIYWPPVFAISACDYPSADKVKFGVIYANGALTGTYKPTVNSGVGNFLALPDVSDALNSWFQNMVFGLVVKTVNIAGELVETETEINFRGVMQPFTFQQLYLKPEGQRAWKWHKLHAEIQLALKPDDVVVYETVQYRVMKKGDYNKYGYVEYDLVQDYEGSGPVPG